MGILTEAEAARIFLIFLFALFPSLAAGIIIHEAGHVIFGRIGGYACYGIVLCGHALIFSSGRLSVCRIRPFMAGKCFLVPAAEQTSPKLAVAGGSAMNLIVGAVSFALSFCFGLSVVSAVLMAAAIMNIAIGASNLTDSSPMCDGETLRELTRYGGDHGCYDRILMIESRLTAGDRITDIDREWLTVPEGSGGTLELELNLYVYRAAAERFTGCFGQEYLEMFLGRLENSPYAEVFASELANERERLEQRKKSCELQAFRPKVIMGGLAVTDRKENEKGWIRSEDIST